MSEDALELYRFLVEQIGEPAARRALVVLDGCKAPKLKTIDRQLAWEKFPAMIGRYPRASLRWLAGRLGVSYITVREWKKKVLGPSLKHNKQ